jgi:hypothetical protein
MSERKVIADVEIDGEWRYIIREGLESIEVFERKIDVDRISFWMFLGHEHNENINRLVHALAKERASIATR